jgi:hypothetical protein
MQWTGWKSLHGKEPYQGHAVYRVRLSDGARAIPITRFLGVDGTGILSIARAEKKGD